MILKQPIKKLWIEQTYRTPEIDFKYGKLRIWGTFVPENPAEFYLPLHEWIEKYSANPAPETVVDFGIKYTGGYWMPYIQKLLQELILLNTEQHKVVINWHFAPNTISVKAGEHLSKKMNYSFNFVKVEEIR
jgi:hypothetical protein